MSKYGPFVSKMDVEERISNEGLEETFYYRDLTPFIGTDIYLELFDYVEARDKFLEALRKKWEIDA